MSRSDLRTGKAAKTARDMASKTGMWGRRYHWSMLLDPANASKINDTIAAVTARRTKQQDLPTRLHRQIAYRLARIEVIGVNTLRKEDDGKRQYWSNKCTNPETLRAIGSVFEEMASQLEAMDKSN